MVWAGINFKRSGYSPHWLWFGLCGPPGAIAVLLISFVLFRSTRRRIQAERLTEVQGEEERRQQQLRQQAEQRRRANERIQREIEERRIRAAEERAAEQRHLSSKLATLMSNSRQMAAGLSGLVQSAECAIAGAEHEFDEGALVPFWERIEEATAKLTTVEVTVQKLIKNAHFYESDAQKLEINPPPFQLGIDTLPNGSHTYARMHTVVRRAYKSPAFANIYEMRRINYEQRKTNELLEAGFSTLGQALSELGDRLGASLGQLASTVNIEISKVGSEMTASHEHMTSALSAEIQKSSDQAARDAKIGREQQTRHTRDLSEKLENIQRKRKPFPPGLRDGEFDT